MRLNATSNYRPLRLAITLICVAALPLQSQIWWTGAAVDDDNWSNAANWFDGTESRLPTASDHVLFGYIGDDPENPVSNTAQNIILDISPTVDRIIFHNAGDRSVSITAATNESLTLQADSSTVYFVNMLAGAESDAFIDVTINSASTNRQFQNLSSNGLIYMGPNSSAGITATFGSGSYRLAGTLTGNLRTRGSQNLYIDGLNHTGTFFAESKPQFKVESEGTVNNLQSFGAVREDWATIERDGSGDRTLTINQITTQTSGNQAILNYSESQLQVIDNPVDEGHLTIRIREWRTPLAGGPGLTPHIVTDANTTVELFGASGHMSPGIVGDQRITGLTGPGNLHMKMDAAGSVFNLQRLTDYTGRTILETGIMSMGSMEVSPTSRAVEFLGVTAGTYYGSLPLGTLVEIGGDATLRINPDFAQTIGGITGYNGTAGTVDLNGGELTVHAADDSSFDGTITGTGALIKSGDGTFTFAADYTNPSGRTLRIEDGVFAVDGILNVTNGSFELAGGRITASSIVATDVTWDVILAATAADLQMVAVTTANITGATLNLALDDDYTPLVGTQFTLLYASDTITGASELDMFGYSDGDSLFIGGNEFVINWVTGSEAIVLTAIPEPAAVAVGLGLIAIGFVGWRRRKARHP